MLLIAFLACATSNETPGPMGADGADGAPGAAGPEGPAGPPGPPTGYHWVDSTGAPVTEGPDNIVFDDDGLMWAVDLETGEMGPRFTQIRFERYIDPKCEGTPYTAVVGFGSAPRVVIETESREWLVRRDDAESVCVPYVDSNGFCFDLTESGPCPLGISRDGFDLVTSAGPEGFEGPLIPVPL